MSEERALVAVFCFNEGQRLARTLARFDPARDYDLLLMDDGSTDESADAIAKSGLPYLRHAQNKGVGAALKSVYRYALAEGYDVLGLIAGNGKMDPAEVPRVLEPVRAGRADYVQGSRYLGGDRGFEMPLFRRLAIPAVTRASQWTLGFHGTDLTCGFRAYRTALLRDPRIDVFQPWLDRYEMEFYLHYKVVTLGYRIEEVPVTMRYPRDGRPYSKIPALSGWWSMLKPLVLLRLGLRQ